MAVANAKLLTKNGLLLRCVCVTECNGYSRNPNTPAMQIPRLFNVANHSGRNLNDNENVIFKPNN